MPINLPKQSELSDFGKVIDCLKNGATFTEFYSEKPKRVMLETGSPASDKYQCIDFPYEHFLLFKENGFLFNESGNWEFKEEHYCWDFYDANL